MKLNYSSADIVINWAGGLHHAKKAEVSLRLFAPATCEPYTLSPKLYVYSR